MGRCAAFFAVLGMLLCGAHGAAAQYLYFSPDGSCARDGTGCWQFIDVYYVFLKVPEVHDAVGARFRLESEVLGPEDIASAAPAPNVTVESGDLFSGITLSWPAGTYANDTLMTVSIALNEPHDAGWIVGITRDIELYRAGGETIQLDDFIFACSHCTGWDAWLTWSHEDTLLAAVGSQTSLGITCTGHSNGGYTGTNFEVRDELGWVVDCAPCGVACPCPACPWDVIHVGVHLSIPPETAPGTADFVRILPTGPCCRSDSTSFYVRATSPTPTEQTSWGTLKSIFKKRE